MIEEGLLEKSKDNIKTAELAEKNNYYDATISRYYYAIFERIIYISKKDGFYSKPVIGRDSHKNTIINFNSNMNKKLHPADVAKLALLFRLKKLRVTADYEDNRMVDKNSYNLSFKYYFNEINGILDKLI